MIMKKLLFTLLLLSACAGYSAPTPMKISDYPGTNNFSPSDLFLIAVPGVTNKNITWANFEGVINTYVVVPYALPLSRSNSYYNAGIAVTNQQASLSAVSNLAVNASVHATNVGGKIQVLTNGVKLAIGTNLNLIAGANITITGTNQSGSNTLDLCFTSIGGGTNNSFDTLYVGTLVLTNSFDGAGITNANYIPSTNGYGTNTIVDRLTVTNIYAPGTGNRSEKYGSNSTSSGILSLAVGLHSLSLNNEAIAIGPDSHVDGQFGIAIGSKANVTNTQDGGMAIGYTSKASGTFATAVGTSAIATNDNALAFGSGANAGLNATALGANSTARPDGSTAIGSGATADFGNATAVGAYSLATNAGDMVLGNTSNKYSFPGVVQTPVLSIASSASNNPAGNEFPTANWVRNLFGSGLQVYNSTNIDAVATSGIGQGTTNVYQFVNNVIPLRDSRNVTNPAVNEYVSTAITTNTFIQLSGPVLIDSYLNIASGGGALTVHPEIYYTYDRTNILGDFSAAGQTVASTATNLYQFVVSIPSIISTNATGFYLVRRIKIDAKVSTPTLVISVGTNTPSHLNISGPNSAMGNALLANNQTFTGTNTFTGRVDLQGEFSKKYTTLLVATNNDSVSNILVTFGGPDLELILTNNITLTNIAGLENGSVKDVTLFITPQAFDRTVAYPAVGTNGVGMVWSTNAYPHFNVLSTTLTNGYTYVISMTSRGSNVFAAETRWRP